MSTYEETMTMLSEMESRYDDGFSYSDRSLLDKLHHELFKKGITNTGCSDCYRDAYLLIISKLKKDKEMPKAKSNYILKAGAIIRRAGDNRFYANPLPNDEIPELYLSEFPGEITKFAAYPADWKARIARRLEGKLPEDELSQEEAKTIIRGLEADVKARDERIAQLEQTLSETPESAVPESAASDVLETLRMENSALQMEVEELRAELDTAKESASKRGRKAKEDKNPEE